jgi:hypothetical protein
MTTRHRFPILITGLGSVLLLPFGVSRRQAVVQVRDGKMHVQFGPMFDHTFSLEEVAGAERATWPLWAGIGPRANLRGAVGLVGAYRNVVRVTFKKPQSVRLFVVPVTCQRLYLSLEDPEGFIEAIEGHLEATARPEPEPVPATS